MGIGKEIPTALAELRELETAELAAFCSKSRDYLIQEILAHGGHFSANLGTVELTVALHYVLETPHDQLVWDVGHQAYLHKVLTGRKERFHTIRKKDGLSGFPKQSESPFDAFGTGHSSTSISAVLGMAEADKIQNITRQHVAVIGDGSLTGGMAWEALNNAAVSETNILVIINDNQMGIDPNAGALNHYLNNVDPQTNFFTDLGFQYFHSSDGHDVTTMVGTLEDILHRSGPKIWHVKTIKGKGYKDAEQEQTKWHSVKYVKIAEEKPSKTGDKLQDVFGHTLLELAEHNKKVVGVTPAMPSGSSMNILMNAKPDRCFDVGIAEQHAVTFSAGLATNGLIPFCNVYSTFLQRAYDQVIHDVCLQNLHVILCLDRAGVVGEDGPTHHGLYDLSFLRSLPNMVLMAPRNEIELRQMMYTATRLDGPVAIRYPKVVGRMENWKLPFENLPIGKIRQTTSGTDAALLTLGTSYETGLEVKSLLAGHEIDLEVTDMGFVKPLDRQYLNDLFARHTRIFTLEDGCRLGGFGSAIRDHASEIGSHVNITSFGFPDEVIEHATREELFEAFGLDADSIRDEIQKAIQPK